jgi:hypothetical protein
LCIDENGKRCEKPKKEKSASEEKVEGEESKEKSASEETEE